MCRYVHTIQLVIRHCLHPWLDFRNSQVDRFLSHPVLVVKVKGGIKSSRKASTQSYCCNSVILLQQQHLSSARNRTLEARTAQSDSPVSRPHKSCNAKPQIDYKPSNETFHPPSPQERTSQTDVSAFAGACSPSPPQAPPGLPGTPFGMVVLMLLLRLELRF